MKQKTKDWQEVSSRAEEEDNEEFAALEHPSYEELEARLTEAEQMASKHKDMAARALAEAENVKRRSEKDVANAYKFSIDKMVGDLLPILDSLENGIDAAAKTKDPMQEGMELTLKLFVTALNKHGVQVVNPEGETFNPAYHEAMTIQPVAEGESNKVLKVLQKGYTLHDRLVRPARVIVSKVVTDD